MPEHVIQVTKWVKPEEALSNFKQFLEKKGYSTIIKSKKNTKGRSIFCLFRNLSEEEKQEINSKKWLLVNNSLERNVVYGPRLKTE